ncbi:MAG: hypothetical protein WKF87_16190 [Chryseolinea sp.]
MARICIMVASAIVLFFGLLHLYGTFFTTDLYPNDSDLILKLKSSHIQMDESGNLWKLWIGFNAMFSVGLAFIGAINLYLAARHFSFWSEQPFIFFLTIASNAFLVWIGYEYIIMDFVISMAIPLCLFVVGFTLHHSAKAKENE